MTHTDAQNRFVEIETYYRSIPEPKYRNVKNLSEFNERYEELRELEVAPDLAKTQEKLINAMSQVIAKCEQQENLKNTKEDNHWSNLSERGMNKVIPSVSRSKHKTFPVEWTDKWGNECYVSNGFWGGKNYRVMDAIGYMFVLKEGGDSLPKHSRPFFCDLFDVQQREHQLNDIQNEIVSSKTHNVSFTDDDFRKFTGLKLRSSEILELLLETSRVEFKLTFPVRLKDVKNKETTHKMNYYSRFFEIAVENLKTRNDGIILKRRYTVVFKTMLGEMFVNNLMAKYNNRINQNFYLLPDSAQICYRRLLLHHDYNHILISLSRLAELTGLKDENQSNLVRTIEKSILDPLKESGFIEKYEKENGLDGIRYSIWKRTKEVSD